MRIEPGETIEHQFDFAVVGGGMAGVLAAYELARDGAVCVLEREGPPRLPSRRDHRRGVDALELI